MNKLLSAPTVVAAWTAAISAKNNGTAPSIAFQNVLAALPPWISTPAGAAGILGAVYADYFWSQAPGTGS